MGVESILKSVSDSAGQDDSGDLRRPHTDDAVPTSAAAIPHQSLTHATLKAPWLTSFVWMSVAAGAGMLGAAAAAAAAWPVALVAAAVAGVASARVILKRRRQIRLRGDRLVEDTGWGSRELRLSEVRLIQQGRRFIQKARDPLSAASLSFKSDDASISFADLKPEGAHEVATAVLQIVAPRLLEQFVEVLANGGSIAFGLVVATKDGLVDTRVRGAQGHLRWREIERVDATLADAVRIFALDRPERTLRLPTFTANIVLLHSLILRQQALSVEPLPPAAPAVDVAGWEPRHVVGGALVCGIPRASALPLAFFGVALCAALNVAWVADEEIALIAAHAAALAFLGGVTSAAALVLQVVRRAFAVYEHGVANRGGFLAFDDVAHLKRAMFDQHANGGYVGRSVTLVLTDSKGKSVRLQGNGDRVESVAASALRRALPLLVAKARQRISSGGSVVSGALVVDAQGLHTQHKHLRWNEIDEVIVAGGCLLVGRSSNEGSRLSLSLDQPDALVVMELVAARLAERNSEHTRAGGAEGADLFGLEAVPYEAVPHEAVPHEAVPHEAVPVSVKGVRRTR